MAIRYKRMKPFVWLNGLVSDMCFPLLKIRDFRKSTHPQVQVLRKAQEIVIDWSHFHFEGNAYWQDFHSFISSDLFYIELENASIISKGMVLDQENRIILESTIFQEEYLNILFSNHLVFLKPLLPKRKEKNIISLLNKLDNNYFHWTLESLTRILLVYEQPFFRDYMVLIKKDALPFVKASLQFLFDIPDARIVEKALGEHVATEKAMVISFPHLRNDASKMTNVYVPSVIRDLNFLAHKKLKLRNINQVFSKNVIISRRHALARRLLNEDQLLNLLSPYGFEAVVLENLSYTEQVALFAGAENIIAVHGAGLANMVYARNPVLVEFFPEGRNIRDAFYFIQITAALKIKHHLLLQDTANEKEDIFLDHHIMRKIQSLIKK